jgi:hypothetical protein
MADCHAANLLRFRIGVHRRANAPERRQVVDPQGDSDVMLVPQLARKAPADADVAIVVDDFAEDSERCLQIRIVKHAEQVYAGIVASADHSRSGGALHAGD